MKKSLLIGLIVAVLALGGIGAAFATGMNVTGVGALSEGVGVVDQIDTDYVGYTLCNNGDPRVDGVNLSFTQNLKAGDQIWIQLLGSSDNQLDRTDIITLGASIGNGEIKWFNLNNQADPQAVTTIRVIVAES